MQLELDAQERLKVIALVNAEYAETHAEIHHAMDHNTREELKQRRVLLERLLKKLGADLHTTRWAA